MLHSAYNTYATAIPSVRLSHTCFVSNNGCSPGLQPLFDTKHVCDRPYVSSKFFHSLIRLIILIFTSPRVELAFVFVLITYMLHGAVLYNGSADVTEDVDV